MGLRGGVGREYAVKGQVAGRGGVPAEALAHPALAQQFAIRSIPTLAVFKNGREVARQAGAMQGAQLQQWLASIG